VTPHPDTEPVHDRFHRRIRARDGQAREDAFRSLNYSTYFAASDGRSDRRHLAA